MFLTRGATHPNLLPEVLCLLPQLLQVSHGASLSLLAKEKEEKLSLLGLATAGAAEDCETGGEPVSLPLGGKERNLLTFRDGTEDKLDTDTAKRLPYSSSPRLFQLAASRPRRTRYRIR